MHTFTALLATTLLTAIIAVVWVLVAVEYLRHYLHFEFQCVATRGPQDRLRCELAAAANAGDSACLFFSLPPVSYTRVKPRFASCLDRVVFAPESEQPGQQGASRASELMRESRANVDGVLHKCRQQVLALFSQKS